jgi:hypothetical protein
MWKGGAERNVISVWEALAPRSALLICVRPQAVRKHKFAPNYDPTANIVQLAHRTLASHHRASLVPVHRVYF